MSDRIRTVPYPVDSGVWTVADLSTFAASVPPPHVIARLRVIAKDREGVTGNACPPDTWGEWHVPAPVSLASGQWNGQKWHTVYLPDTPRVVEPCEPRGLVPGNRVAPNIPPRTLGERWTDARRAAILSDRARARAHALRRRVAARRALARMIARGGHAPPTVV